MPAGLSYTDQAESPVFAKNLDIGDSSLKVEPTKSSSIKDKADKLSSPNSNEGFLDVFKPNERLPMEKLTRGSVYLARQIAFFTIAATLIKKKQRVLSGFFIATSIAVLLKDIYTDMAEITGLRYNPASNKLRLDTGILFSQHFEIDVGAC